MNLMMANMLNSGAVQHAEASSSTRLSPPSTTTMHTQVQDDLRAAALRMRLEMPLKERIIHLQTFKYTFTGQQAVAFLQQQGLAGNQEAAADMCQRMLFQGLFKSIYHREVFVSDAEIYRFSSSFPDGNKQKGRIPGSITSTGLYKEIAKIGKTAAQPFKNIQLSLNDTLSSLGNLNIPTPPKPSQRISSLGAARPRSSGNGVSRAVRRSQTGKLHVYGDSTHGPPDTASSLAALVANMEAMQANIKESTSLVRLDLQQHTALQEHLVGILMAHQDQLRVTQLLIAINAAAVLCVLGFSGTWVATLAAGCLLAVLLYFAGPEAARSMRQPGPSSAGLLLRRSSVASGRGLEPQLSRLSRLSRPAAGVPAGVGESAGHVPGFHIVHDSADGDQESDEVEDHEDSIPYSEDFDDWPDAPVMLCPDPAATQQEFGVEGPGPCHALTVNGDPIPFETPLFKGVVAVFIRHLPTTPLALFKGKKRLAWVALQGTFKQPVSMEHLVYGMEFTRQLTNLPAPWFLENMLLPLARKISPSLRVGTLEDPYFFTPIITASQVVNVSLPGQAPPLMEAKEDTRLLQAELGSRAGDGLSVAARRKHFQVAANRHMDFSTEYVWTFHLWQEYIDYASYMLNLGYSSYDLTQHLDGQPLQLMAKDDSTGQQLISLHVWHANLVRSMMAHRMPRRPRVSRVSNVSHEDTLQDRSAQVTQGGFDSDAAAATSPLSGAQQPQDSGHQALLQQQYQQLSTPLPALGELPLQQGDSLQQDPGQQLHQQEASQQQQVHLMQQQPPPPQGYQLQQEKAAAAGVSVGRGNLSPSLLLPQQQVPLLNSLSDSRLQRPVGLQDYHEGGGGGSSSSKSDPDGSSTAARMAVQQLQLSNLRPSLQQSALPVIQLQQQLSLPTQQSSGRGSQADVPPLVELQSLVGSNSGPATASTSAATGLVGRSDSWTAAARTFADSRPARFSAAAAELSSGEGFDSPQAHLSSGRGAGSAGGTPTRLHQTPVQQVLHQPQSAKKKKKEQKDKEDQQRQQQLHGLSVMGAL